MESKSPDSEIYKNPLDYRTSALLDDDCRCKEEIYAKLSFMVRKVLQIVEPTDEIREGLKETPDRVVRTMYKIFGGYGKDGGDVLKTFKENTCKEMVIAKDIEFYSTCEHHLLPFFGKVHIGYLPNNKVVGLSKLARLVEIYSRRLQIQEHMTSQIADALQNHLEPIGVMVIVKAKHLCMMARGVEKQRSSVVTSAIRGEFDKKEVREEFLQLIQT